MAQDLIDSIKNNNNKKALVFGTNIGAEILKIPSVEIYTDINAQIDAIISFDERFDADFLITAMDLSVEAECFGSDIVFPENGAPQVGNRLVASLSEIERLDVPPVGDYRSKSFFEITEKLLSQDLNKPVIGGIIGPFSLAGRLFGVKEMFQLVLDNELSALSLISKCNQFVIEFARAYQQVGCQGVVISEPSAGLMSPVALSKFSSMFIKKLIRELDSPTFRVIYHNCGARVVHLDSIFETEASIFHFGEPMDILAALQRNKGNRIISGNLDPVNVFLADKKEFVIKKTTALIHAANNDSSFLIAPGCDLPAETPLENMDAFYSVVHSQQGG
ncbi:MAG: uroporphyrinogen decarboxylase family protein [Anaerolineaceae bacterium]|nr:uroporphyrinogen decarboxylase family protein [Anaerolineaceae bacterium]